MCGGAGSAGRHRSKVGGAGQHGEGVAVTCLFSFVFKYFTLYFLSYTQVLSISLQDKDASSVATQLADLALQMADMVTGPTQKTAPISLAELLGVAVAMYSWAGEGGALGTAEEEEGLKDSLATLALQWRPCDVTFLGSLGISKIPSIIYGYSI